MYGSKILHIKQFIIPINIYLEGVFFRLKERLMNTSRYTHSPPVDHAHVYYFRCVTFVISLLFPRVKTQRKRRYNQLSIILQKTEKIIITFYSSKHKIIHTSQILQHTHISVNTVDYHCYIEMHYRNAKQRVSTHLNTNSRLSNVRKYKNTNSITLYKKDIY